MAENHDVAEAGNAVVDWLCGFHELTQADLNTCIYRNHGLAALKHLVRVSAGLNSMVLGEPQIFGQIKSAYAVAQESGVIGDNLGKLFPEAFHVAKRVRTDTAIGENPVSVACGGRSCGQIFQIYRTKLRCSWAPVKRSNW